MSENDGKLDKILNIVSKYLGKTPEEIKSAAMSGDTSSLLSNFSQKDADLVQKILADKDLTQKILSTKLAQNLVKDVFGSNNED